MATDPFTISGMLGTATIVVTYFTNQHGWVSSHDWRFPFANLVGALLILSSFYVALEPPGRHHRNLLGGDQRLWPHPIVAPC